MDNVKDLINQTVFTGFFPPNEKVVTVGKSQATALSFIAFFDVFYFDPRIFTQVHILNADYIYPNYNLIVKPEFYLPLNVEIDMLLYITQQNSLQPTCLNHRYTFFPVLTQNQRSNNLTNTYYNPEQAIPDVLDYLQHNKENFFLKQNDKMFFAAQSDVNVTQLAYNNQYVNPNIQGFLSLHLLQISNSL